MRIEPHENLAVWAIRQDMFGPGRWAPPVPGRTHVQVQRQEVPVVHVKVVHESHRLSPADCPPCDRGGFPGYATPSGKGIRNAFLPAIEPAEPTCESGPAPGPQAGGVTLSHGQIIPGTGGLLDIMA